jgi:hypothetical protein
MESFIYSSEQSISTYRHGKGQTRRNIVSIRDGKGIKAVETYTSDGKYLNRKEKPLTEKELECIQKNKFIPGLFKDCIKPIMRPKRKTVRNRSK